jgi:hypothetical protein
LRRQWRSLGFRLWLDESDRLGLGLRLGLWHRLKK